MQKIDINLPPGDFIDLWKFSQLIARSICPSLRKAEEHTWIQHKLELVPGTEFETRHDMTEQERALLLRLLPELPSQASLSKETQAEFMDAFLKHPERPSWRPVLLTEVDAAGNAFEILHIQEQHLLALRREVAAGNIRAFDKNHISVQHVAVNIFTPREDALRYLDQQHLRVAVDEQCPVTISTPKRSPRRKAEKSLPPILPPSVPGEAPSTTNTDNESTTAPHSDKSRKPVAQPSTRPLSTDPSSRQATIAAKSEAADHHNPDTRSQHVKVVILRRKQVEARMSLSRSAIYDRLDVHSPRYDPSFPKQMKLGRFSVGWSEAEVDAWLTKQANSRS